MKAGGRAGAALAALGLCPFGLPPLPGTGRGVKKALVASGTVHLASWSCLLLTVETLVNY